MTTERATQDEWRASETENGGFYAPGGHYWIAGPGNFHAQGKAASERQEKVRDQILAMRAERDALRAENARLRETVQGLAKLSKWTHSPECFENPSIATELRALIARAALDQK